MSDEVQRVEVITSVQRRRRRSVAEKIRLVEETLEPGISVSFVARKHGISPNLLFKCRQRMAEGGREAVRADDVVIGAGQVRQLEERTPGARALARPQDPRGRDPREGALHRAGKKTAVVLAVARAGRFPMNAVADTLGVARSNLVEQAKRGGSRPRPPYRKAGDAERLARLRAELDSWFEDYNEMHPHRALGMRSPRQFIRAQQPAACPV